MRAMHWIVGAAGALALGLFAASAEAAPAGHATGLKAAAGETTAVEQVRRRCWRHRGHWHCRRYSRRYYPRYVYGSPYYGRSYYYGAPYYYGRRHRHHRGFSFYGPGFGFSIGRGHRHWW
jgi:hypothetical protein